MERHTTKAFSARAYDFSAGGGNARLYVIQSGQQSFMVYLFAVSPRAV